MNTALISSVYALHPALSSPALDRRRPLHGRHQTPRASVPPHTTPALPSPRRSSAWNRSLLSRLLTPPALRYTLRTHRSQMNGGIRRRSDIGRSCS
jgi:hypothetical protein